MAFNHYAKLAGIIISLEPGWYIQRINEPTTAKTFSGETRTFDHYYRIYSRDGVVVPYGKFQQIERLAQALKTDVEALPVVE